MLGRGLQRVGFFNNRGTAVLLSKGESGTIVSFVLVFRGLVGAHPFARGEA
jgi:hypothetical protein